MRPTGALRILSVVRIVANIDLIVLEVLVLISMIRLEQAIVEVLHDHNGVLEVGVL